MMNSSRFFPIKSGCQEDKQASLFGCPHLFFGCQDGGTFKFCYPVMYIYFRFETIPTFDNMIKKIKTFFLYQFLLTETRENTKREHSSCNSCHSDSIMHHKCIKVNKVG